MLRLPGGPARFHKTHYIVAVLIAALAVVLSVTGFAWASARVTVIVDGAAREYTTHSETVASLLAEAGVRYTDRDLVSPSPRAAVEDGGVVVVRHAVPVVLVLGSQRISLDVVGRTVADALLAAGLDPTSGMRCEPPVDATLEPGLEIRAADVFMRVVEEEADVAYATEIVGDATLPSGARVTRQSGSAGRVLRIYQMLVVDGVEGARTLRTEKVLVPVVNEVVALGTQKPLRQVVLRAAGSAAPPIAGGAVRAMKSTAYTPWDAGCNGIKVISARKARYSIPEGWGVIAVDPAVIPLGTRVFVEGYGYAVAADTGGVIHGNIIDVCYWGADLNAPVKGDTEEQRAAARQAAHRWGVRSAVRVTILGR